MLFDFHLGGYASLYLNASFNTFQNKYSLQNYFRFPLLEEGNHACCCFSFLLLCFVFPKQVFNSVFISDKMILIVEAPNPLSSSGHPM